MKLTYIITIFFQNLRTPWLSILKTRGFWGTLSGHIGSSVVYILFFVDMPTYLEKGLHISLTSVR